MKSLGSVVFALLMLGCVPPTAYRGGGATYRDDPSLLGKPAAQQALLASAALHMSCPERQLAARGLGYLNRSAHLFVVDGCGKRATYVRECRYARPDGQQPQACALGACPQYETGWEPGAEYLCDYLLIARTEI
jgi:hypothetical protein